MVRETQNRLFYTSEMKRMYIQNLKCFWVFMHNPILWKVVSYSGSDMISQTSFYKAFKSYISMCVSPLSV